MFHIQGQLQHKSPKDAIQARKLNQLAKVQVDIAALVARLLNVLFKILGKSLHFEEKVAFFEEGNSIGFSNEIEGDILVISKIGNLVCCRHDACLVHGSTFLPHNKKRSGTQAPRSDKRNNPF
jgi:hypothetical protein